MEPSTKISPSPSPSFHINTILECDLHSIPQTSTDVRILWSTICTQYFPSPRFIQSIEKQVTVDTVLSHEGSFFECLVVRSCNAEVPDDSKDIPIFVIVYKDASQDTQVGWTQATTQMLEYCRESLSGDKRVYGAVAIGTKVRLFCCSYPVINPSIEDDFELKLEDDADRRGLEEVLKVIRRRGRKWAVSMHR
ncbi:hypothetical protein BO94DRAFT_548028 [Aspergillus sclerotioniger CBS 115572]|uniref:Uncharacterized protein n=1 Tax=Aspergillus sclerotioniger CBS 115572 TaxID=1450535 RepID=A0A317W549_9EURO|nr:hypothetical protein BO94DRAFT_548028 [Aspergillus sclerotioniger CBS 115572]PWY81766.1 hypothetical protein BO94DRAFT_548028 [Aspergillus sclerotioniger CBS 115572]